MVFIFQDSLEKWFLACQALPEHFACMFDCTFSLFVFLDKSAFVCGCRYFMDLARTFWALSNDVSYVV